MAQQGKDCIKELQGYHLDDKSWLLFEIFFVKTWHKRRMFYRAFSVGLEQITLLIY